MSSRGERGGDTAVLVMGVVVVAFTFPVMFGEGEVVSAAAALERVIFVLSCLVKSCADCGYVMKSLGCSIYFYYL